MCKTRENLIVTCNIYYIVRFSYLLYLFKPDHKINLIIKFLESSLPARRQRALATGGREARGNNTPIVIIPSKEELVSL
jgi:hypothetical protein